MSHTISKDELRRPDQLTAVGRNLFYHTMQNQKLIIGVLVMVALAGVGYVLWEKTSLDKELQIQEQYYVVEKTYLKKKEGFEKSESSKKDIAKADDKKVSEPISEPASGDLTKDYGSEVEGWTKLIDNKASSKAAAMAALELSHLYLKYNKNGEALQILSKVKNQQNSDSLLGAMVFHAYASLLSNQGQCQEAVSVWENLEKKKKMSFIVEQAQLGRALCLETLGQVEKAEGILNDLVAGKAVTDKQAQPKPKDQTQRFAEKYLRYLKVKKNATAEKAS